MFDLDDKLLLSSSPMTTIQLILYCKQQLRIDNNWQPLTQVIIILISLMIADNDS